MAYLKRHFLVFAALFLATTSVYSETASACFDDRRLTHLQSTSKRGALVYVWSPRMVYSVQQMTIAARLAAVNGLDFVVVHDARVPRDELPSASGAISSSASRAEIKLEQQDLATPPFVSMAEASVPLCAKALIDNEALRHFPTAFIVTALGVHRHPIVGAMPTAAWQSSIAQRLQQP